MYDKVTHEQWLAAPSALTYNWSNALLYCRNGGFNGHTGWHLPTATELMLMVDMQSTTSPYFANSLTATASYYAWTSTTYMSDKSQAYAIASAIPNPFLSTLGKVAGYYVYCVRNAL